MFEPPFYNEAMYQPVKLSSTFKAPIRGLQYQIRTWGRADAKPLLLLHGWMDVSASFQFLVDQLADDWFVIAPDWRGYGGTQWAGADAYWFADYLADLDALIDYLEEHYGIRSPLPVIAHSMGGNVAMLYAGIRPQRFSRLVNLEGYGLPQTRAAQAPKRYAIWLDQLKDGQSLRPYADLAAVAARLRKTNPRLNESFALWLAQHWSVKQTDGQYALAADPVHKAINPLLYRVEEVLACWRQIEAPVLLVESSEQDEFHQFTRSPAYRERLLAVPRLDCVTVEQAGHMLHHDQPTQVAHLAEQFLLNLPRPLT
jgi:pimeloyl-ACP methyl ester carboxylesterase